MNNCLLCGGTLVTATGEPCPECTASNKLPKMVSFNIPHQYQGVKFDRAFLPTELQEKYGTFMEDLLKEIVQNYAFYQKNLLICARPNAGKTIWAYNLYAQLYEKGIVIPAIKDLVEVRDLINKFTPDAQLYSTARCAIIKVPIDFQFWMVEIMAYIVERRVRSNGFTIFIYSGKYSDLESNDKYGRLKYIKGSGAFNTLSVAEY